MTASPQRCVGSGVAGPPFRDRQRRRRPSLPHSRSAKDHCRRRRSPAFEVGHRADDLPLITGADRVPQFNRPHMPVSPPPLIHADQPGSRPQHALAPTQHRRAASSSSGSASRNASPYGVCSQLPRKSSQTRTPSKGARTNSRRPSGTWARPSSCRAEMEGHDGHVPIAAGATEGLGTTRVRVAESDRRRAEFGDDIVNGAIGPRPGGGCVDKHSVLRRSQGAPRPVRRRVTIRRGPCSHGDGRCRASAVVTPR